MAFFPHNFYGSNPSFTPLFRLLEDFDNYSREAQGDNHENSRQRRQPVRTFNPRFDVRETENAYELHGELPGVERENVHVEFPEPQTLVIRGRVERTYTAGTPPAGLVEGGATDSRAIEGGKSEKTNASEKTTVEDDATEISKKNAEVTPQVVEGEKPKTTAEKYWVAERSIGEFSRTFNFPARVDQDEVSANLNNGILTVFVPKAKKHESRRIDININ